MILIDKNKLKENHVYLKDKHGNELECILTSDLTDISKEVEVVDDEQDLYISYVKAKTELTYFQWLKQQGYQLIKTKE